MANFRLDKNFNENIIFKFFIFNFNVNIFCNKTKDLL